MDDSKPTPAPATGKRPCLIRRIRPAAWFAMLAALAVTALVELPGQRTGVMSYSHGWPCVYLQRDYATDPVFIGRIGVLGFGPFGQSTTDWSKSLQDTRNVHGLPWEFEQGISPWSIDGTVETNWLAAAADILLAVLIVVLIGWLVQRLLRHRAPATGRRRYLQFRLRTMFVVVTIAAAACGIAGSWYSQYRVERAFMDDLQAAPDPPGMRVDLTWRPPAYIPESLLKIGNIGEIFQRIDSVEIAPAATDAHLGRLADFPNLSQLTIEGPGITAAGIKQLARLPQLKSLTLDGFHIDDAAIAELNHLRSLELLTIWRTTCSRIEINGLDKLQSLTIACSGQRGPEGYSGQPFDEVASLDPKMIPEGGYWRPTIGLKNLSGLKKLSIEGATFDDNSVRDFGNLSELESLDLAGIAFHGTRRLAVTGQRYLSTLSIYDCDGDDFCVRDLPSLKSLAVTTNARLRTLDIEQLPLLDSLTVFGNYELTTVRIADVPKLPSVALPNHPQLQTVDLQGLDAVSDVNVSWPIVSNLNLVNTARSHRPGSAVKIRGLPSLGKLETLDLSGRLIDATNLDDLNRLTSLKSLSLAWTWLGSPDVARLRPLVNLTSLDLRGTDVTSADLANLDAQSHLEKLDLSDTQVLTDDAELKRLQELHPRLRIESSRRSPVADCLPGEAVAVRNGEQTTIWLGSQFGVADRDVAALANLDRLEALDLRYAAVTDAGLKQLKNLPNLHVLNLEAAHITDAGLAPLKKMQSLQILGLADTNIRGPGLVHLGELPNLVALDLSHTLIDDAGLAAIERLTNLRQLCLSGTEITDAGLIHLARLPKLRSLDLSGTRVTDAGIAQLRSLTELQSLDLGFTSISDAGLGHVAHLGSLQTLRLGNCQIAGPGLDALAQLSNLTTLDLDSNQRLAGSGLTHLAGLQHLKTLALDKIALTAADLSVLAKLPELRELSLANVEVTNAEWTSLVAALNRLPSLKTLHITFGPLVPNISGSLDTDFPKLHVDWGNLGGQKDPFWPSDL